MRIGGYRPGGGRPPRKPKNPPKDIVQEAYAAKMQPLEYMLAVMNDPAADVTRRDRMAIAAASFCHPRFYDTRIGKKERETQAASVAGAGTDWADDLEVDSRAN
jgi:hypothetical protein